jgi:very-short-patch-repair endonuclease
MVDLEQQAQIGAYPADFLLRVCHNGAHRLLAVECDGHDWHERTPYQAARDRSRDRFFLRESVPVIRFTGTEINRDVGRCVREILAQLNAFMREMEAVERSARGRQLLPAPGSDHHTVTVDRINL